MDLTACHMDLTDSHCHFFQMGLEVDPELEAQAQVLYDEGMELFKEGQLRPSYEKFNGATDLVPVRSKVYR